eukprot:3936816-Prorocentrum_lima.AAC.1
MEITEDDRTRRLSPRSRIRSHPVSDMGRLRRTCRIALSVRSHAETPGTQHEFPSSIPVGH